MPQKQTLYFSDEELDKIEKVAGLLEIQSSDNKAKRLKQTLVSALNFILENKANSPFERLNNIEKMLEQIHVATPHILSQSLLASRLAYSSSPLDNAKLKDIKDTSMESAYNIIGQFQAQEYKHNYLTNDGKNMKTIPIEKEKNKWKYS